MHTRKEILQWYCYFTRRNNSRPGKFIFCKGEETKPGMVTWLRTVLQPVHGR